MTHQDYPNDETSQAFFKALVGEDHLGFVIRAHIHIEHELRRLIEIAIPHPEHLDVDQLSYSMAVRMVISLGLNVRFRGPLQALGKLRNKFAHQLDAHISDDDAIKFYNSFSTVDKQVIDNQYEDMRSESLIENIPWEERDAKDKITFCIAVLRGALLAAQDTLAEGPPELRALLKQMSGKFD